MIVADANLLVHLVFPGEHSALADRVYSRDPDWAVPLLCVSELRNVAWKFVRRKEISLTQAIDALERASIVVVNREYSVATSTVLDLAARSGCSAYDCEYVALAQALGVPLVTADQQVLRAFPTIARPLAD